MNFLIAPLNLVLARVTTEVHFKNYATATLANGASRKSNAKV